MWQVETHTSNSLGEQHSRADEWNDKPTFNSHVIQLWVWHWASTDIGRDDETSQWFWMTNDKVVVALTALSFTLTQKYNL